MVSAAQPPSAPAPSAVQPVPTPTTGPFGAGGGGTSASPMLNFDAISRAMQALAAQGLVAAAPAPSPGVPAGMDPEVWRSMLQADPSLAAGYTRRTHALQTTPLHYVLDATELTKILQADPAFAESLLPHLPEGQRDMAHLLDILRSPQLRQAAGSLTAAMQGPINSASVLAGFGLDPTDAMLGAARHGGDAIGGLVAAVQAKADKEKKDTAQEASLSGGQAGAGGGSAAPPPPAPPSAGPTA